jgi:hypothetical protein
MTDWVLRVEGVNLDATVYNTNDLSVVRGSSLVLEAFGYELQKEFPKTGVTAIFTASSTAAYTLHDMTPAQAEAIRDQVLQRLRRRYPQTVATPPFTKPEGRADDLFEEMPSEHMTFVSALVPMEAGEDPGEESHLRRPLNLAIARCKRAQMAMPGLPPSPAGTAVTGSVQDRAKVQCPVDPMQQKGDPDDPGAWMWTPPGRYDKRKPGDGPQKTLFSARSAHLRKYGHDARQKVYGWVLGETRLNPLRKKGLFADFVFARHFEDIHELSESVPSGDDLDKKRKPLAEVLPGSLPGKLAVIYVDGSGFTRLANERPRSFPEAVRSLYAEATEALLNTYLDNAGLPGLRADAWRRNRPVLTGSGKDGALPLRLETYVVGGDDAIWIVPSFLALELAELVLRTLDKAVARKTAEDATSAARGAAFRAGVAIAPAGTPFRRIVGLAYQLMNDAKKVAKVGETYVSALSVQPVESMDLRDSSDSLSVLRSAYGGADAGAAMRWRLADHATTMTGMRELKAHMARGAMMRIAADLEGPGQEAELGKILDLQANRGGKSMPEADFRKSLPGDGAPLVQRIRAALDLWDYVDPLARMK